MTCKDKDTKDVAIIVNGQEKFAPSGDISFDELVQVAFVDPPKGVSIHFTITYRGGEKDKPKGTLDQGGSVKVNEGMIFNVTATDKS